MKRPLARSLGPSFLLLVTLACNATSQTTSDFIPSTTNSTHTPVFVASPTIQPSLTQEPSPTATTHIDTPSPTTSIELPSPTTVPSAVPTASPHRTDPGCLSPPDDYHQVEINGETLNARTLWMLHQAAALYGGPADLLRVTQGSYSTGEATSFGTHAGGGAVDISIRAPSDTAIVLWDETDSMVLALRLAGFAAWYRAPGDLGSGSPAHVHAIAIGDRELSPQAIEQLIGPSGYLRGFDGLPSEYGGPHPDPHGGPIICQWMIEMGYSDLRE